MRKARLRRANIPGRHKGARKRMKTFKTPAILIVVLILAGCATIGGAGFEYEKTQTVYPAVSVTTERITQDAARALRDMGFTVQQTDNSPGSGYLYATRMKGSPPTQYTYILVIRVFPYEPEHAFDLYAKSVAGRNVTLTHDLPKIVDEFFTAFDRIMKAG